MSRNNKWVMIADSHEDTRELISSYLELNFPKSLRRVHAASGMEAFQKISFQSFDCIIADSKLPKKDTKAFISAVRHSDNNQNCPVIILKGEEDEEKSESDYSLAEEFEFIYYTTKPINKDELLGLVEQQLKLGASASRVAADLFNAIIESCQLLISHSMKLDYEMQTAEPKKTQNNVNNDYVCTIEIQAERITNYFLLGLNSSHLDSMKSVTKYSAHGFDEKRACRSLAQVIINHAFHLIGADQIKNIKMDVVNKGEENYLLKRAKGILIPIKTISENMHVGSYWPQGK